ncbi:ABC transporter ATP-binding protein [Rubrimonas cliftonensis]|uniref:Spermidine/putrescine transport system ATP-binding protein n=1 Tax=Rubrimonas cliftonensis TaxID=89524 RepID=A0A1H3W4I8_9RHOB|nr:ABC transporter ATP-binding protein [Rubrimonas cliftonensis]SDZ81910.1 spermidine/putrescine transport system ATP-binding protein [Rubrimonas cliftonensis]
MLDQARMQGREVALDGLSMRFGDFTAVHPTDLTIRAGEFFSILGPSGCGKTTVLRAISGFAAPSAGRVLIGGDDVTALGPNRRPTALIFQSLALFPLMTVWENVAFGLEARGMARAERRRRADALLELVALEGQGDKRPAQLSGGQRQRVAVARALAVEPAVLLLDEPLSALDLKLRQHMRAELKAIQRRTGVTFVYITHDQGEALTMSDRIAVMNAGRIEQVDAANVIYDRPETPFVATFVGEQNVFEGRVESVAEGFAAVATPQGRFRAIDRAGLAPGEAAAVMVRPERTAPAANAPSDANRFTARVERIDMEGPYLIAHLRAGDAAAALHVPNLAGAAAGLTGAVEAAFRPEDAAAFRPGGRARG